MCPPRTRRIARTIAAGMGLGITLAGCSDIYYDRRDVISLSAGDAVAANAVAQMVDPWPALSGDTNIPANGQKMQIAVERYRTDRVISPINPTTSDVQNQQLSQMQAAAAASAPPSGPPAAAPAPPPTAAPSQ